MNDVALILIGWLLGLLGPAIQERIKLHYQKKRILEGIVSELSNVREQCTSTRVVIESKAGRLNQDLLTWYAQAHPPRVMPPPYDQLPGVLEKLKTLDKATFDLQAARLKASPGGGLNMKMIELPYTQLKLTDLELHSEEVRQRILDIMSRVRIFNQHVEESKLFFALTFDSSLSEVNHRSASAQVQAAYDAASEQSRMISDLITLAISEIIRSPNKAVEGNLAR